MIQLTHKVFVLNIIYNKCPIIIFYLSDCAYLLPLSLLAVIICDMLAPINNGSITYSNTPPYEYDTVATYLCDEGFFLEGDESINCTGDGRSVTGTWGPGTTVCAG